MNAPEIDVNAIPFIFDELAEQLDPIKIVEIGSLIVEGQINFFSALMKRDGVSLIGFEPQPDECKKLNDRHGPSGATFFPYAIGDGTKRKFHVTEAQVTSGFFPFHPQYEELFNFGDGHIALRDVFDIQTTRLDDIPEVHGCDLLKLDAEGAELMILENAKTLLTDVLIIDIELNMLPNQIDGARYFEVGKFLEEQGFVVCIFEPMRKTFKPWYVPTDPWGGRAQVFAAEAVFIRDFTKLENMTPAQFLKMGVLLQDLYGYRGTFDVASYFFQQADKALGTDFFNSHIAYQNLHLPRDG